MTGFRGDAWFREVRSVDPAAIDDNGHMNNVVYVQWMQDIAIRHFTALGGMEVLAAEQAAWVARSHHIDYLAPAASGDRLEVVTWVATLRRATSIRRYRFRAAETGRELARGETVWVLVDRVTGKPKGIPRALADRFTVRDEEPPGA